MKIKFLSMFFILISNSISAQILIKGLVQDFTNFPIVSANVLLKDSSDSKIIAFSITDFNGLFKINNKEYEGKAFLVVSSLGYKKESYPFILLQNDEEMEKNFVLKKEIALLEEIQVKAKGISIHQQRDTVTYSVSKFTDGTEEVIEDVIKKLPGLEVAENGNISYNGTSIDKVLIEGDDLFDKNYTIATKNIRATIINKVQAIENYQENKNLKGIKDSDKKVLNIILNEDAKAKPYGNGKIAYGFNKNYDASLNFIGVNKNNKYYILGNTNNIGVNSSPFDYLSTTSLDDEKITAKELINIDYFIPNITSRRININKKIFGATNLIFKPSEKLRIKPNIFLSRDKNNLNRTNESTFITNTKDIHIIENQNLVHTPLIIEGNVKIDYNVSDSSEVNYNFVIKSSEIKDKSVQKTSNGMFKEHLLTENYLLSQKIIYTNRFSDKSALLLTSSYIYGDKPQEFFLTPSIQNNFILNFPETIEEYATLQKNRIELNEFDIQSQILQTHRNSNLNITLNYNNIVERLNSHLIYQELDNSMNFETGINNLINYRQNHTFIRVKKNKKFINWKLIYGISGNFKSAVLVNSKKQTFYLSPILGLEVKLGSNFKFKSMYSYEKSYPSLSNLYGNYVLTNYRTFSKGYTFLNVIGSHVFLVNYSYSDWFNQFNLFINFIHIHNDKAYTSKILIEDSITFSEKIFVSGNKNYIGTAEISKFLPPILSTIKFNTNLSWYSYFNIVNESELKNNLSFSSIFKLTLKSGFEGFFNFETATNLVSSIFTTSDNLKTENKNIELYANFIFRPHKKWLINISNERLAYNINEENNLYYYFLDTSIKYTLKENKLAFRVWGKNLINEIDFSNLFISDYYISKQRFDLLPRHILFEINYRF